MHELPQLGKLEDAYRNELVVIGVQSPKYPAEGEPEALEQAVGRYGIEHPVVNDPDYRVWESFAVNAWPTLVFISPQGEVIGRHAGEAPFEALSSVMDQLIAEYEREGTLSRDPVSIQTRPFSRPPDELSFPGKVLATDDALFIADSDHHRIVITDLQGGVQSIAGSGEPGLSDGDFHSARFYRPQGMALDPRGVLYVADSENHAIRALDLDRRQVRTVAGTGEQAYRRVRSGPALETALSSPWDLALAGDELFIAMAGLHQVWQLDFGSGTASVWAGTGHEGLRDGSRTTAWLAQPMGLSLTSESLFVACAESQAVRRIDFASGAVGSLVGEGLFAFGDEDGPVAQARLQHVQDVAAVDETVYAADTYNNKIKVIDTSAREVRTYAGSGRVGTLDGPGRNARFNEPAGLSVRGHTLYIADTNNHLIRTADLDSGHVGTLRINGLPARAQ